MSGINGGKDGENSKKRRLSVSDDQKQVNDDEIGGGGLNVSTAHAATAGGASRGRSHSAPIGHSMEKEMSHTLADQINKLALERDVAG